MTKHDPAEVRLARELAARPDEARTRVLLGALALASDEAARGRRLSSDAIAAIAATVVAVASLVLAVDQTRIQRKQLAAAVWPSLRIGYSNFEDPEHPKHRLFVANGGVGPARIQSFAITWRGKPVIHVDDWAKAACPAVPHEWIYGTQTGTLLSPGGQAIIATHTRGGRHEDDVCIHDEMLAPAEIQLCYCSALDDCWVVGRGEAEPTPVHDCTEAKRAVQFEHGD